MAYAPLDVANTAFAKINVTAAAAYTDNTPQMITFRQLWQNSILVPVLRAFGWNCCLKRAALTPPSLNVSAGSAVGGTVTLTIGTHTLQIGQTVYVNGATPADWNGTFVLTGVTGTTISYAATPSDSYSSGGVVSWAALMDWAYVYQLPADYVRIIRLQMIGVANYFDYSTVYFKQGEQTPDFKVENGLLLTNQVVAQVLYVARDMSTPPNPPNFDYMIDILADRAAFVLAIPLTGANANLVDRMEKRWERTLMLGKIRDSQEGTPTKFQEDDWIRGRN